MNTDYSDAIERAAGWVVEKRLESPAILFLELHKPVAFLMGQLLYFGTPILAPLFGFDKLQKAAGVLSDRDTVETFISLIEKTSIERQKGASDA